jgi:hypothetical protein
MTAVYLRENSAKRSDRIILRMMHVVTGKKKVKLPRLTTMSPGNLPTPGILPVKVRTAPSASKITPINMSNFPMELTPFNCSHLRGFQNIISHPMPLTYGQDNL